MVGANRAVLLIQHLSSIPPPSSTTSSLQIRKNTEALRSLLERYQVDKRPDWEVSSGGEVGLQRVVMFVAEESWCRSCLLPPDPDSYRRGHGLNCGVGFDACGKPCILIL